MAAIAHDVVNAFNAGKRKARGSFASNGDDLMSYGFRIAWRTEDGKVHLNKMLNGYAASVTTSTHLSACRGMVDDVTGETLVKAGPGRWELRA